MPNLTAQLEHAFEQGDIERVMGLANERLRQDPRHVGALSFLARALLTQGSPVKAAPVIGLLIQAAPATGWAYRELAQIALAERRHDEARNILVEGLRCAPEAATHEQLGVLHSEQNALFAGEFHFREALSCEPSTSVHVHLARNLVQQGRIDDAEQHYRAAHGLEPSNLDVLAYWAKLQELRGELDEADKLLHQAERIAPGQVNLLRAGLLARVGKHEQALRIVEQSSAINGDAELERGAWLDRMGRYDEAWSAWRTGNRKLAREGGGLAYQADAVGAFFGSLQSFFDPHTFARLPRAALRSGPQPLFVIGSPRSGTTLIERILDSHSMVRAGGELPFVGDWRPLSEALMPGHRFPANLVQLLSGDRRHVVAALRDTYLERTRELGLLDGKHRYFVDKMPFNEMYLPLIHLAFPQSPVVHMVRHPLDVALSMFSLKLNHGFHCAYRMDTIAQHLAAVFRLHQHYSTELELTALVQRYEDLVSDPFTQIDQLLKHLDLPFEEACLHFHQRRAFSPTPSYDQVNQALHNRSVGRFKRYQSFLNPYRETLGVLLKAYGYA